MSGEHPRLQDWLPANDEVESGATLFRQGDPVREVFWVAAGLVKLVAGAAQGHDVTIGLRGEHSLLGQADAVLGQPHGIGAVAVERSRVCRIAADRFRSLLASDGEFSDFVLRAASRAAQLGVEDSIRRLLPHPEQRLARLLSIIERREGRTADKDAEIPVSACLGCSELASLIGCNPAQFQRLLAVWEQAGCLRRQRGALVFLRAAFTDSDSRGPRDAKTATRAEGKAASGFTRALSDERRVRDAIRLVAENYMNADLDLGWLSREMKLSTSHLSRLLNRGLGRSLPQFLRDVRIEQARVLLVTTPLGIKEIAADVGYRSASEFSRSFKAWLGVCPRAYRTRRRPVCSAEQHESSSESHVLHRYRD